MGTQRTGAICHHKKSCTITVQLSQLAEFVSEPTDYASAMNG